MAGILVVRTEHGGLLGQVSPLKEFVKIYIFSFSLYLFALGNVHILCDDLPFIQKTLKQIKHNDYINFKTRVLKI